MDNVYLDTYYGPSPRAWGLLMQQERVPMKKSVHPHVRGVYGIRPALILPYSGPSPRAWGLRLSTN